MTGDAIYDLYKDDWRYVDAIEDVTWVRDGQDSAVSKIKAVRGDLAAIAARQLGSGFVAQTYDLVMILWDSTILGTERPSSSPQERIYAGGTGYTIENAQLTNFDTVWVVGLKKMV